jgi:ATP-dependent Clp protease ATP-binding subunit ClpB
LLNKKVLSLDLSALLAGAGVRGQFEERFKALLKDIDDAGGGVICFIDEIHTLLNLGKSEGSIDAGNMIKPVRRALSQRLMERLLTSNVPYLTRHSPEACSWSERQHSMSTARLLRRTRHCLDGAFPFLLFASYPLFPDHIENGLCRFQPVKVEEPSVSSTISILRGLKSRYEVHHGVGISDASLVTAAVYSQRYIPDRFLPDKAIDLVDEAASALRIAQESKPPALETLEREIVTLEIERESLKNETDTFSVERKEDVERELEEKKASAKEMEELWMQEKNRLKNLKTLKEVHRESVISFQRPCH